MKDLSLSEMLDMQRKLHEHYRARWGELVPGLGKELMLWMMAEAGEAAQVIKKQGDEGILMDEAARSHFVEEMCDVLMYFGDVLLAYSVAPEEIRDAYIQKYERNMTRWPTVNQ